MHSKWVFKHFYPRPKRQLYILAALWTFGLLAGVLLCNLGLNDSAGVLLGAALTAPSPLGLFLVCMLPVTLTAIALVSPLFVLAYIIVFLGAVSHGFCGIMIYMAQGSAAWLLRPMLLFSSSCISVLVWWLFLKSEMKGHLHRNIRLVCILAFFIYAIDLFIVSPFVDDLAKYF